MERKSGIPAGPQKARGRAFVLAIGTANPDNVIPQAGYPDLYFQLTDSGNSTGLKRKFKRICDKTMIKKRHTHHTQDLLENNRSMLTYGEPSLEARQDILISQVPELGKRAALVAIQEWAQPKSKITHLMFHSTSGVHMPGADCRIIELLGLPLGVKRTMLYHQGSYVGGTLLRMAKDTAENNPGARILVVCSEITLGSFHGPCEADLGSLLAQAIMGDGAAALIIGADPDPLVETPLFELMSASQTLIPHSDDAIEGSLREMGLTFRISRRVPELIFEHTGEFLRELSRPYGRDGDWNSFFWAIHTGGRAILDQIEATLRLNQGKLDATRHVLSEYGNMGSASVFFVLDEIRRRGNEREGTSSAAGGGKMDWGILFAFGAGLTLDAVLLRRFP